MTTAVSLQNVSKSYGEFKAVDSLSLDITSGCVFGLLGPNGAGKTTTIRMIVNITVPDSGSVYIFGEPASAKLRSKIGYLPEERGLYKKMKVREQLLFLAGLKGVDSKDSANRIVTWAERLKIAEWLDKKTEELSKGMQQKIQFIAALLHEPRLLILDEPFSGLDPVNTSLLMEVIRELSKSGVTIILSTHVMEQVEKLCDEICLINKSRKVLAGRLRDVKSNYGIRKLLIAFDGGDSFLKDDSLSVERFPEHYELNISSVEQAQQILRKAINAGAIIRKFELLEPSLHEIFVNKVTGVDG
ncbi:MAG: ATP-binding cassette domain-containing protein [Acidobacteriota bacterium]|nr:ATP-binding cassette domain-containing protein [Blastocatellia bacterium]MDW8411709.1 ATP-binding cassette domain-containing protein [Acidobacteriota bacterium]